MTVSRDMKVGAFVLLGLLVAAVVVFLIGDERRLFEKTAEYRAVFADVQGLKRGSPVRMGGVDIGRVSEVGYGEDTKDIRLHVTLEIVESEASRIRVDSTATIESKGLLGDKMVVVRLGSPGLPVLPPGGEIRSELPRDLEAMLGRLDVLGDKAEAIMGHLEKTTATLADEQVRADLKESVHSLGSILHTLDTGNGFAARLLRDPAEADRISRTIANLEQGSERLNATLAGVDEAVRRVNQGPGFAHDLVYGEGPGRAVAQVGQAADEVAVTLRGLREGNGIGRSLIYGDSTSRSMMSNLDAMTQDLRAVAADLRAGKGTMGALLVDPSVYEDVKVLLGNVERNQALRALVRYSIRREERAQPVRIVDPGSGSSSR